jgi:NAD(P)-dependent dehydrogenase (short-subunit alcohol dehydrogenase family)
MLQLSQRYPTKRAFITGGGSGLGKALCLELAKEGWTIGICDISRKGLDQTASAIKALGGQVLSYELDVSDRTAYEQVVDAYLQETNGIDLLINNAG